MIKYCGQFFHVCVKDKLNYKHAIDHDQVLWTVSTCSYKHAIDNDQVLWTVYACLCEG
jgi:sRNA-binding regulator protein Hfq